MRLVTASRGPAVAALTACAALAPLACLPDYQLGAGAGPGGADAGKGGGGVGGVVGGGGGVGGGPASTTTTGSAGAGGSGGLCGGSATGAGGDSPSCQGCGDVICTGQPVSKLCEASQSLYAAILLCGCCEGCAAACAENACPPTSANHVEACAACVQVSCADPYAECLADRKSGNPDAGSCW